MKVLVTGGAGYVGSVLVPRLLDAGRDVIVLDSLMFGGRSLLPCFSRRSFRFVRGDVRDETAVKQALPGVDAIIHLAAIVGYPACKKNPDLAYQTNVEGTRTLNRCRSRDVPIIFASTGSNYGAIGDICREDTPLNPLSIYGTTKTEAEKILLDSPNVVAYRFATAFGVSNRMRLDLLVNDFCYQAKKNRNLIVYEKSYKRTFIHVTDMARAFLFAVDHLDQMKDNVYNCGHESMNCSKEELVLMIRKRCDFYLHFAEVGKDEDQRNYEVSYEKLRRAGFETMVTMDEGIDELLAAMDVIEIKHDLSNV